MRARVFTKADPSPRYRTLVFSLWLRAINEPKVGYLLGNNTRDSRRFLPACLMLFLSACLSLFVSSPPRPSYSAFSTYWVTFRKCRPSVFSNAFVIMDGITVDVNPRKNFLKTLYYSSKRFPKNFILNDFYIQRINMKTFYHD